MKLVIDQKKTIRPYGKSLDVNTIKDLLIQKLDGDDYGCAFNIYNPKCSLHKAKEKANKLLMENFEKKTKRLQNKHRKNWKSLPYGEVIKVEITFPKVTFAKVTSFLIEYEIPFEIVDYDNTDPESMQEEIDYHNKEGRYDNVVEEYEKLYADNLEDEEDA